nr:hypothetical protein Iba_chr02cCG5970 [Ipomoea batatas]
MSTTCPAYYDDSGESGLYLFRFAVLRECFINGAQKCGTFPMLQSFRINLLRLATVLSTHERILWQSHEYKVGGLRYSDNQKAKSSLRRIRQPSGMFFALITSPEAYSVDVRQSYVMSAVVTADSIAWNQ